MDRKVKNVSTLNYSQFGFKDFKMGKIMVLCRIHLGESRVRILYEDWFDLRVKYKGFVDYGNSNVTTNTQNLFPAQTQTKLTSRLVEVEDSV